MNSNHGFIKTSLSCVILPAVQLCLAGAKGQQAACESLTSTSSAILDVSCREVTMRRSVVLRWLIGSCVALQSSSALSLYASAEGLSSRSVEFESCSKSFSTITAEKTTARRGQTVTVPVVFHPVKGWTITPEVAAIKVFPPAGISTPRQLMKGKDAAVLTAQEGRFDVVLASAEAGKKIVPAVVTFIVCNDPERLCEPQIAKLSIELDVQ